MRFFTAGESHGPRLTAIIEGLPAGLPLQASDINVELKRRQGGYGRGGRMKIESDQVEITSGLRHGKTLGSPLTLNVTNRDFSHWTEIMAAEEVDDAVKRQRKLTKPRPGHADLVGGMKYEFEDLRNTLERSSARETTMRVAVGAVAKALLKQLDMELAYHVVNFGGKDVVAQLPELTVREIKAKAGTNDLSIVDISRAEEIRSYIDKIKKAGDTIGGIVEVRATNVPAGLGSYVHFDRKLDAKIAAAVVSINAFKGVELIIRGVMKPIPTLYKPLMSVNTETHEPYKASVERSDPTALPAAGVVMENVVATVLAQEICDKFSSDSFRELQEAFQNYKERLKNF